MIFDPPLIQRNLFAMKKLIRIVLHAASLLGLMVIALTGRKDDLIYEMDPSIPPHAIEHGSGNHVVVAGVVFALVALVQAVLGVRTRSPWERTLSASLIIVGMVLVALSSAR
ncbi:hypothetical protein LL962_05225 [Xanthomonas sp. NCPPB 1067]|uniref:hypothetical protein n=1 Tax=Pseudomonadota TaxID=1224 RepID=UPI001E357FB0|nr:MULTISPECIES: hypothetical protein [Pseudomonadota]MCC4586516.1 hypothetical protein [Xanthomonas sp. NCPPB 1067]GKS88752.1 hypothetical protein AVTE2539_05325 [Acidovorax sp. SUPP2539]